MSYGSSEAGSISQTDAMTWEDLKKTINATGKPYPGMQVKVISTDGTGKTLNRHDRGELCLKAPSLLISYLNNESATKEAIDEDGWLHTGDIGIIDDEENVSIVDRLKEVIKVKG